LPTAMRGAVRDSAVAVRDSMFNLHTHTHGGKKEQAERGIGEENES